MERLALPFVEPPDFYVRVEVASHVSKKNSRPVRINPRTGKSFIGKNANLVAAENWLMLHFLRARNEARVKHPITSDVSVAFRFYFDDFYSKKGYRRKNLPDLSNLCQLPEDILQRAEIIQNDSQIISLDGSRRLPGPNNVLEVWLWSSKD